jgi:hypothetical protein
MAVRLQRRMLSLWGGRRCATTIVRYADHQGRPDRQVDGLRYTHEVLCAGLKVIDRRG